MVDIKTNKKKRSWLFIFAIAFAIAIAKASISYFSPSTKSSVEAEINRFPVVKLLLEQHPELREQFVQDAVTINNHGSDYNAAILRQGQLIQTYFEQYITQASDESIISFVEQRSLIIEEIRKNSPESCPDFINGRLPKIGNIVSISSIKKMLDIMGRIVETAIKNPQPKTDPEWAEARLQQAWDAIDAKNDPNFTFDFANPNIKPEDICYSVAILYKTIQETLLANEVGAVFRYMLTPE